MLQRQDAPTWDVIVRVKPIEIQQSSDLKLVSFRRLVLRLVGVGLLKNLRLVFLQQIELQRATTEALTDFPPSIYDGFTPTLTLGSARCFSPPDKSVESFTGAWSSSEEHSRRLD